MCPCAWCVNYILFRLKVFNLKYGVFWDNLVEGSHVSFPQVSILYGDRCPDAKRGIKCTTVEPLNVDT